MGIWLGRAVNSSCTEFLFSVLIYYLSEQMFTLPPIPSGVKQVNINDIGCDPTSCLFLVSVRRVSPRFSIPPSNHEVMPGGSVNLTCVAVGSPMPYVKWIVGEVELTKEDDMPMGRNVLELINITHSANYTCEAMSSLGVIHATAQITVKGKTLSLVTCIHPQCQRAAWETDVTIILVGEWDRKNS